MSYVLHDNNCTSEKMVLHFFEIVRSLRNERASNFLLCKFASGKRVNGA